MSSSELTRPNAEASASQANDVDVRQESLSVTPTMVDIEHTPVENDPRQWSPLRKNITLTIVSAGAMIAGLAASIQNPAVREMEIDLPATSSQFSLSISLFILTQGSVPLVWASIGEIKGRKIVYLTSIAIFAASSVAVAVSNSIELVIAFRVLQAAGSSAVITVGTTTLADIFDPKERGSKVGIYYMAPLLGPAIGPIFGGALTTGFNWRAIFWFLTVLSGAILLCFLLFFKDTFRRERSAVYQKAMKRRMTIVDGSHEVAKKEAANTEPMTRDPKGDSKTNDSSEITFNPKTAKQRDVEKGSLPASVSSTVKLTLADVDPFRPIGLVLRRINNLLTLAASGLIFAFCFLVPYTSARTLSTHYGYEALKIGLVTLSFGFGGAAGSLLGGRWSDYQLARLTKKNAGISQPEMRLRSTIFGIIAVPPVTLGFGWICQKHLHVSVVCVFLFACGFLAIWIYASTLAYIVDANNGRSSSAVATNSLFRGVSAFIAVEVAVPMQDNLGDGWMYTIWAAIMVVAGALLLLVLKNGGRWREHADSKS
ncbi:MFS general substrate transporter [Coprinopsis marcescibilis]|uniref:MFS general substrate transporter n=1 Tax=Coprinopsis marcescibilis TaxID=230819 RepID=A0A5C3KQT8_COPMA|nr:MFS general substrate transporter [Coprinopsis marcescibilis]